MKAKDLVKFQRRNQRPNKVHHLRKLNPLNLPKRTPPMVGSRHLRWQKSWRKTKDMILEKFQALVKMVASQKLMSKIISPQLRPLLQRLMRKHQWLCRKLSDKRALKTFQYRRCERQLQDDCRKANSPRLIFM